MKQSILADYLLLINQQIHSQEILLAFHLKIEAMLKILLGSNLASYSKITLYHYLWGISDMINEAKNLNEHLLNVLVKKMAEESKEPSN